MTITGEEVARIARLARLQTSADEAEFYAGQLTRILELVAQMKRADTADVEPMAHPQETALRLRDDCVLTGNRRDEYQKIAPATEDGLYLVPKVIDDAGAGE